MSKHKNEETTGSLVLITVAYVVIALLVLCGCNSTGAKSKAVFETKVPDVWVDNPVQEVSIRIEVAK